MKPKVPTPNQLIILKGAYEKVLRGGDPLLSSEDWATWCRDLSHALDLATKGLVDAGCTLYNRNDLGEACSDDKIILEDWCKRCTTLKELGLK